MVCKKLNKTNMDNCKPTFLWWLLFKYHIPRGRRERKQMVQMMYVQSTFHKNKFFYQGLDIFNIHFVLYIMACHLIIRLQNLSKGICYKWKLSLALLLFFHSVSVKCNILIDILYAKNRMMTLITIIWIVFLPIWAHQW